MKNLIIFDMDGTLLDSSDSITKTINYVRSHLGLEAISKNMLLEKINDPYIKSSEFFYNSPVYTKKQRDLFEEYYYEICTQNLKLYDGIYELLNNLKNDFYLSVATNAYTAFAKKMLSHLNIDDFFINITGADLVENSKPHPDMIEKIIKELNHNKQTLLIGDSLKDAYAAQNANIDSILVNWGFTKHKEDYVEDTKELLKEIYARFNI